MYLSVSSRLLSMSLGFGIGFGIYKQKGTRKGELCIALALIFYYLQSCWQRLTHISKQDVKYATFILLRRECALSVELAGHHSEKNEALEQDRKGNVTILESLLFPLEGPNQQLRGLTHQKDVLSRIAQESSMQIQDVDDFPVKISTGLERGLGWKGAVSPVNLPRSTIHH
jgi:hypothetical protein